MDLEKLNYRGSQLMRGLEHIGLVLILLATLVAIGQEVWAVILAERVHVEDLLLLFIYLEIITMVQVYWRAGQLPVRMPLYIAMVALARYIILDPTPSARSLHSIILSSAILILAVAVLVVRYGHIKLPYESALHGLTVSHRENRPEREVD